MFNEEFSRSIAPFLKPEYFEKRSTTLVFEQFMDYFTTYNSAPTKEALILDIETRSGMSEDDMSDVMNVITCVAERENEAPPDLKWLKDSTLAYCQERSIYNAVTESISIINGDDKNKRPVTVLPDLLADALAVTFDEEIGHDYLTDAEARWEFYHRAESKVKFSLDWMDKITNGGINKKTLNLLMAETGGGKTLMMCSLASDWLILGQNVLYVTMEMAAEKISERIDANLMDVELCDLPAIPKDSFLRKAKKIQDKTSGKLVVKEFPTSSAHAGHIRHLLRELKIKKKFTPDVVIIDYINICASSRVRSVDSSYTLVKSIAEEMRGLAVEADVAILTATQTNRCLRKTTEVETPSGTKKLSEISVGDIVLGNDGFNKVTDVHTEIHEKTYKVTLASGKEIVCSGNHVFPVGDKFMTIDQGLSVGMELEELMSERNYLMKSKIVKIEEISEQEELIDISLTGNRLFYANGILTHNCGWGSSDLEMGDISESSGLAATVDMMLGIIATEEMKAQGTMMVKQLKNRYTDVSRNVRNTFNVERSKMRMTNCEDQQIVQVGSAPNRTESTPPWQSPKKEITGFKF